MNSKKKDGLYIQMYNIHGLLRGENLELGRDSDTGGQTKYVLELAKILSEKNSVRKVQIMTRLIDDKNVSDDYAKPVEKVNDKLEIIRIRCGGKRYIAKELLWDYLDEYVDKTIKLIKADGVLPDIIHSHYADAGYVATQLTRFFGIPLIHTGHSLGRMKKQNLMKNGWDENDIDKKFKMHLRIPAEENVIFFADRIITSTNQEITDQWGSYENFTKEKFIVIPPSISLDKFHSFKQREWSQKEQGVRDNIRDELWKFFTNMYKPLILSLCRPEKRKNIGGLIQAYGKSKELQEKANLAIFAGIRKDIQQMPELEREVLTEMLLLMDKYNLYGKMAIPKRHDFEHEVPELYRTAAETQGVFVNSAFSENFGLTLIEAAASGLPIIATHDGGPKDIINNLENGILVDVHDPKNIADAINKILDDSKLWKKYSQNGVGRVDQFYSWDAHADKYLEIVNDVLNEAEKNPKTFIETTKKFLNYKKLIILDIDETITGDDDAMYRLKDLINSTSDNVGFGVATGRTIDSACELISEVDFVKPDVIISSVGSEIYYNNKEEYVYSKSWDTHIKNSWKPDIIRELLNDFDFIELQEDDAQRKFKLSYNLIGETGKIPLLSEALIKNRVKTNLIISHGRYIDFLPFRASKGRAIRYLSYRWNIPHNKIIVGGDSGNDEDMLTGELLGIVVGNHSEELAKLKGRRRIYFADNNFAAGVIEGINHYNFLEGEIRDSK